MGDFSLMSVAIGSLVAIDLYFFLNEFLQFWVVILI